MDKSIRMPALYIPHGGGPAFFMTGNMRTIFQPMADFLSSINDLLPAKPSAILMICAHWETSVVTFCGGSDPALIYDYYGFPQAMYELSYPASGDPELARRAMALLKDAQLDCQFDADRGWDHGVFIPLKVMYPDADIPVVAMSLQSDMNPEVHGAVGWALAPLREEGVLIVGSGMSYHNLSQLGNAENASVEFDAWLDSTLTGNSTQRYEQLKQWLSAPSAREAHPREDHLLPLMVASGAGSDLPGVKIWQGSVGSSLVSAWAFN